MKTFTDGHKIRVILKNTSDAPRPEVICPFQGMEYDAQKMTCAEVVNGKVTGCWVQTNIDDAGWECLSLEEEFELKEVPFEIEWWIDGSFEDAELWISPIQS